MRNTERLPRVEARFTVIAPAGGYQRQLRMLDLGTRTSIDVHVVNGDGVRMWLRITPTRRKHDEDNPVVLHPDIPSVYLITEAQAVFITHEGGSAIDDKPVVDIWASINTVVQALGQPAGTLKIWEHSFKHIGK